MSIFIHPFFLIHANIIAVLNTIRQPTLDDTVWAIVLLIFIGLCTAVTDIKYGFKDTLTETILCLIGAIWLFYVFPFLIPVVFSIWLSFGIVFLLVPPRPVEKRICKKAYAKLINKYYKEV